MHRIPAARTSSSESSCSPAAVSSGHTSSIEIPSSQDPASGYTGSGSKSGTIWLILFMTIPPEAMITAAAAAARIHTGAHPRPGRDALRPEPALWFRDTGASEAFFPGLPFFPALALGAAAALLPGHPAFSTSSYGALRSGPPPISPVCRSPWYWQLSSEAGCLSFK